MNSKIMQGYIEQLDAIGEELFNISLSETVDCDVSQDNCQDMLVSLRTEMQEFIDTQCINSVGS